ncbi:MAG: hypothetical protein PHN29_07845 [Endomicrobiaceae bacterium]|nr:hypothetical protein [Endomicrobiaceae bacterium]
MNHLKDSEETRNKIHYAYILVKEWLKLRKKNKKKFKKCLNPNGKVFKKQEEGLAELKIGVDAYIYDLDKPACLKIRYYSDALKKKFKRDLSFDECKRAECKKTVSDITEEHMICRSVLRDEFIKMIKNKKSEKHVFNFLNKHLMICTMTLDEEKRLRLVKNRTGLDWKKYYKKAKISKTHKAISK